jgi:hypothetical protein
MIWRTILHRILIVFSAALFLTSACNIQPNDPGTSKGNLQPETFIAPTPQEGSTNNPFRIRLQWRGNDSDGRVREYQYRIEGPLYDNTWQTTANYFQNFKLRQGWYTIQVRAVDDDGAVDPTPATRRFHVLGPTFDKGILLIDDDKTEVDDRDDRKDALMDSLMMGAGYTKYTVWDYETMFGITETIAFTDKGIDLQGQEYFGLSAYTTVIWTTGTGGENNISKNERLLTDFLDMGGKLWLNGTLVMQSILGDTARGAELASGSFARKYLKIRSAKAALIKTDLLLSQMPGYPDLITKYTIPTSGLNIYLENAVDQLFPDAEADILYSFSNNVYVDEKAGQVQNVNSEEFAGTPVAIKYSGKIYKTVVFGFPLVYATKRAKRSENNIIEEDMLKQVVRNILRDEFQEVPQ